MVLILPRQRNSQIEVRCGAPWIQRQCLSVAKHRVVEPIHLDQQGAQIVLRFEVIGIQGQCLSIAAGRFLA